MVKNAGSSSGDAYRVLVKHEAISPNAMSVKNVIHMYPECATGFRHCHIRALHNISHAAAAQATSEKVPHTNTERVKCLWQEHRLKDKS